MSADQIDVDPADMLRRALEFASEAASYLEIGQHVHGMHESTGMGFRFEPATSTVVSEPQADVLALVARSEADALASVRLLMRVAEGQLRHRFELVVDGSRDSERRRNALRDLASGALWRAVDAAGVLQLVLAQREVSRKGGAA